MRWIGLSRPRAYRQSRHRVRSTASAVEARRRGLDYMNGLRQRAVRPLNKVFERSSILFLKKVSNTPSPSSLTIEALIPQTDGSYSVTNVCTGCGICAKVSVEKIWIVDGRPVWKHRCGTCLACFNSCPTHALHGSVAKNEYRYRHPDLTTSDMICRR